MMNKSSPIQLLSLFRKTGLRRGSLFGIILLVAMFAFEVFNYTTTDFALSDLLGKDLTFAGVRWATILAVAFCGIGRPESFKQSLEEIGIRVDSMIAFHDHHWYSPSELRRIVSEQEKWNAEFIITTEKDFVRISQAEFFEKFPFFYIEVEAEIHQKEEWNKLITSVAEKKN